MKVGWWVGADIDWAFQHLSEHLQKAMPELEHVQNAKGDINIVMAAGTLLKRKIDKTYIMHLDGNRFFEDRGVYLRE